MEKAKLLLVLPAELKEKLEKKSAEECRSMNSFVNLLLTRALSDTVVNEEVEQEAESAEDEKPKRILKKK